MIGSLLSAGTNLLSGLFGRSSAAKEAEKERAQQREFAQSGIQWKVEDAKKAGIHPLYALGAQTASYSPINTGAVSDYTDIAKSGQDIGRAIDATRSGRDRISALQTSIAAAQLDGLQVDNQIKRAELASKLATNSTRGPGMPERIPGNTEYDGQGDPIKIVGPGITVNTRRDVTDPNSPAYIPGSGPSVALTKNTTGGYTPMIPPELAEALESDPAGYWDWMIRNRYLPNFNTGQKPSSPKAGYETIWNSWKQQWELVPKGRRRFRDDKYGPWFGG